MYDLIERAGGINALANVDAQTHSYAADAAPDDDIDVIVMSWCGVIVDKYRADIVLRRDAWHDVAAIRSQRVVAISVECLGRPGPRLVEGYRQPRTALAQSREGRRVGHVWVSTFR